MKKSTKLSPSDFSKLETPPPAILFYGNERIRVERAVTAFCSKFPREVETFDCRFLDSTTFPKIQEALASLTLFSDKKFVILKFVEQLKVGDVKNLAALLKLANESTPLIAQAYTTELSQQCRKLFEDVVEIPALKGYDLKRWIAKEAKSCGLTGITDTAIQILVDRNDGCVDTIASDLSIMGLYAWGENVEPQTVAGLFNAGSKDDEFALIDRIMSGQVARSFVMFEAIMSKGKSPHALIALLSRGVSNLHTISCCIAKGMKEGEIRAHTAISPWYFNRLLPYARRYSPLQVQKVLDELLLVDLRLKSKSVDPVDIIAPICNSFGQVS